MALVALPALPEIQPFSSEQSESGPLKTKSIITFLCSLGIVGIVSPQCIGSSVLVRARIPTKAAEKTALNCLEDLCS